MQFLSQVHHRPHRRHHNDSTSHSNPDDKLKVVLLDAIPGPWDPVKGDKDPDGVMKVMKFLKDTPVPVPDRRWLKQALTDAGFTMLAVE